MKRSATRKNGASSQRFALGELLGPPLGEVPTGEAFRPEWIDFERGIRVGNLEPHERITRILKHRLESRYGTGFITDRWGRGVYWQWICWISRANREAKPISHNVNFGCAKFFIQADRSGKTFQFGLQVERGYVSGRPETPGILLQEDWDWHRLMKRCVKGSELDGEMRRLVLEEGFTVEIGDWTDTALFTAKNWSSVRQIRDAARRAPSDRWAGFQLYYPMPAAEVRACTGYEIVQAVCGAFAETIGVMNMCTQVPLAEIPEGGNPSVPEACGGGSPRGSSKAKRGGGGPAVP